MKLTNKEKDILNLALTKLDEYYDEREKTCREFKWICHDFLPQYMQWWIKSDKPQNYIEITKVEIIDEITITYTPCYVQVLVIN